MSDAFQRINFDIAFSPIPLAGSYFGIVWNRKCIDCYAIGKIAADSFCPVGRIGNHGRMLHSLVCFSCEYADGYATGGEIALIIRVHLSGTRSNRSYNIRSL